MPTSTPMTPYESLLAAVPPLLRPLLPEALDAETVHADCASGIRLHVRRGNTPGEIVPWPREIQVLDLIVRYPTGGRFGVVLRWERGDDEVQLVRSFPGDKREWRFTKIQNIDHIVGAFASYDADGILLPTLRERVRFAHGSAEIPEDAYTVTSQLPREMRLKCGGRLRADAAKVKALASRIRRNMVDYYSGDVECSLYLRRTNAYHAHACERGAVFLHALLTEIREDDVTFGYLTR